jgi:hypothetical protein
MIEKTVVGYLIAILAYVVAFGLTTFVIAPVQGLFLPEITVFASLMYLPHGIRILATWALGWRAVPALVLANLAASALFVPDSTLQFLESAHAMGVFVGAVSAFAAFEISRALGVNLYFGGAQQINWKGILSVGILASIINSIGQSYVYGDLIALGDRLPVLMVYLLGDVIGLIACLIALMLVFRWQRLRGAPKRRMDN